MPGCLQRIDMAQHLLRVVDLRAFEPARAGHAVVAEHAGVWRGRLQIEELPDRTPERLEIAHRPAPQRVVGVELQAL
jgi:hypothetical protein